jgi:hypothetical protein
MKIPGKLNLGFKKKTLVTSMETNCLTPSQISSSDKKSCFVLTKNEELWYGEFKFVDGKEKFIWTKLPPIEVERTPKKYFATD